MVYDIFLGAEDFQTYIDVMTDLDFPIKYPALNVEFEKAKVILQYYKNPFTGLKGST